MVERYETSKVIIGFILITFPMSYFISSTFHPPLQHLPLATKENLAHYHVYSHHLHGPLHDNHYHANGQETLNTQTDDDSIDRQNSKTDSRSYSSRKESRNRLHIQSHRHHERNDDPRHGHPRETPANPQQRHRENVNQGRRPKRCLTVGWLATSKESAHNPDEESKKIFNAQNSTFVFKAPITNLHIHK